MEIIRLGPQDEQMASDALWLFGDGADLDATSFL
jgi:ribosomal protein S18 acetylase RimI-like enzyme